MNKIKLSFLKDPIPTHNRWSIYFIPCAYKVNYIVQTERTLRKRLSEKMDFSKDVSRQRNNYLSNDDALEQPKKKRMCKCIEICQLFLVSFSRKISFYKRKCNWFFKKYFRTLLLRLHYAFIINAH